MIIILGIFLIFLSWLFDDVTTYILMLKGYSILETNPLFIKFGLIPFLMFSILMPIIISIFWVYFHNLYRKLYYEKGRCFKLYDIFVFFFCLIVVWVVFTKLLLGWNHINMILDDMNEEQHAIHQEAVDKMEAYAETKPIEFKQEMITSYEVHIVNVSYWRMMFVVMFAYLLFRVGYKVKPYGM